MRCQYTYLEDGKYKNLVVEECGNDADLKQFNEAMEYAASKFDTIPACGAPF